VAGVPALACGGGQILRLSSGDSTSQFFFHRLDRTKSGWEELKCRLPLARVYPGDVMAYDPPRKRFLLFGGGRAWAAQPLNDTWVYDLAKNEWTEIKPAASPPARFFHQLCYDSGNDLMVVHGGAVTKDKKLDRFTDTWVFDAARNSWFEITPAQTPPERTGLIEYDPANKCCIAWNPGSGEVWTLKISPTVPAKTPTPAGPAAFRAEWKELKLAGEAPVRRQATTLMTYDTKRRRCALFGGWTGAEDLNDLWTLDLAAGRWTCLQKSDPKAAETGAGARPGPTKGKYNFTYDEGGDQYWLDHSWAYQPDSGQWKQRPGDIKVIEGVRLAYGWWERGGWAYDPDGKRFLGGGPNDTDRVYTQFFFFYPDANKGEPLPATGAPPRYVDGGLAYDRKQKVFVLFGGTPYQKPPLNDTWVFNPATKEWRQAKPPVSPPGRSCHKLVWHDRLGALVMAGGATDYDWKNSGYTFSSDLWVYETAAERWTEVKPPTAPPPGGAATCYDASQDAVVLFNDKGQTWTCKIERVEQK